MAIIVSDIISEYGAYYLNSGQNMARLKRKLLFGRKTVEPATKIRTDNTVYQLSESNMTEVVQAFQKQWTPKGDLAFTPNPIQLFKMKVDLEIYPDDIDETWLGFLASNGLSRKEWPLIRYIMEEHLPQRIDHDLETKAYYKGVFQTPTPGTAGAAENAMNGLKVLLQSNNVNHLTMPTLDPATIYDWMETFYENIAEEYQETPMVIGVAPKWYRAFLKDKRTLGYYDISSPGQINNTLDFSPARVLPLPSMIGTDDVWATPQSNYLHVTKRGENAIKFKVEEYRRNVSILTDWFEGLGFGMNGIVWTNVPEVTP